MSYLFSFTYTFSFILFLKYRLFPKLIADYLIIDSTDLLPKLAENFAELMNSQTFPPQVGFCIQNHRRLQELPLSLFIASSEMKLSQTVSRGNPRGPRDGNVYTESHRRHREFEQTVRLAYQS